MVEAVWHALAVCAGAITAAAILDLCSKIMERFARKRARRYGK